MQWSHITDMRHIRPQPHNIAIYLKHIPTHSEISIQQTMSSNFKITLYCNTVIVRKVCNNLLPFHVFCISTDKLSHQSTIIILASNGLYEISLIKYAWKIAWQNKMYSYLQITFYWENPTAAKKITDKSPECFMMQDCFPWSVPPHISFQAI